MDWNVRDFNTPASNTPALNALALKAPEWLSVADRQEMLDTPNEPIFERITRLAALVTNTMTGLISLVPSDDQRSNLHLIRGVPQTGFQTPFCAYAMNAPGPFVIEDALADSRFAEHPYVTTRPGIRFYIGHKLCLSNEQSIGTLCVTDTRPSRPTLLQISALSDLAHIVTDELELRQTATTDSLTGALTRRILDLRLEGEIERCHRYGNQLCVVAIDIDHFHAIHRRHGAAAGDTVLQSVTSAIKALTREVDLIGRIGVEEFVLVLPETGAEDAMLVCERLRQIIERLRLPFGPTELKFTASIGVTEIGATDRSGPLLRQRARRALFNAQTRGSNRVEFVSA